jgi:catechol 2,3-dioxygenase-like lactoylglutathione lyase family enzyme
MFDHIGIEVRDLERSKKFYSQALEPLGSRLVVDLIEWDAAGFGIERPQFWIGKGTPTAGDDEVHICFTAKNRKEVRAFFESAIQAGGRENGKPGLRPQYHPNYYGAFVLDPDGYNIEACCHLPE